MPTNFGQAVSGLVAARKRKHGLGARGIGPATGAVQVIRPVGPMRDAEGMTMRKPGPKPLLPGKKYGASGQVVQDTNLARVEKRNRRESLTGSVSANKKPLDKVAQVVAGRRKKKGPVQAVYRKLPARY